MAPRAAKRGRGGGRCVRARWRGGRRCLWAGAMRRPRRVRPGQGGMCVRAAVGRQAVRCARRSRGARGRSRAGGARGGGDAPLRLVAARRRLRWMGRPPSQDEIGGRAARAREGEGGEGRDAQQQRHRKLSGAGADLCLTRHLHASVYLRGLDSRHRMSLWRRLQSDMPHPRSSPRTGTLRRQSMLGELRLPHWR